MLEMMTTPSELWSFFFARSIVRRSRRTVGLDDREHQLETIVVAGARPSLHGTPDVGDADRSKLYFTTLRRQPFVQASSLFVFASSHCSVSVWTMPSPQRGARALQPGMQPP